MICKPPKVAHKRSTILRKRIALLIAQADEKIQHNFIESFLGEAFKKDYDVCVFAMHQKYQETALRDVGDSNIYNLPNWKLFDAVVICKDSIQTVGVAEKVEERLHNEFDGPVLVVDKESEYFPTMMIDHYTPVKKVIDHLIEVHGYKRIYFLNGREGHIHSIKRYQAYLDSMMEHGLRVTEDMVYPGDFWYTSGNDMVRQLVSSGKPMPEAIACANDCMAIGVAAKLEEYGYRIPEDIAVVGYDSNKEGIEAPVPLTSADVPSGECGKTALMWVDAKLNNKEIPEFKTDVPLFIGKSCGCDGDSVIPHYDHREHWETEVSRVGYYSCFNHFMDDLLAPDNYKDFYYAIFQYVYQIRDFESFSLCLNDNWNVPGAMSEENAIRHGYTKKMSRIIKCGSSELSENRVDFNETFDTEKLIPELTEAREKPAAFFFTPLFFEDKCFGYAQISFGDKARSLDEVYRLWLRNVMQGIESFNRQQELKDIVKKIEASQIRDSLTGLYNYRGFVKQTKDLENKGRLKDVYILITAVDLNRLKEINSGYGRQEGDEAICILAQFLSEIIQRGEICARMGNDEFIIGSSVGVDSDEHGKELVERLTKKLEDFNASGRKPYKLDVSVGYICKRVSNIEQVEMLVNDTVSKKNGIKQEQLRLQHRNSELTPEDLENDKLVKRILDENLFVYHFQPIVNSKTGEVFAYEALMRTSADKNLPPPVILQSAERMERLYDIEKATFFNVVQYIENHHEQFKGKKVFINSIPGYQLSGADREELNKRMLNRITDVVVEFTEETEIDDEQLLRIKKNYKSMNIEMAIDDYGSGYSNVNNLLRYMPRYVKIDRMLISEIEENPQKQHFVKDIIEFAHDNNILALAEGVETASELKEAIRLGVDLIQGYYTAKPASEPLQSLPDVILNEIVQYNQIELARIEKRKFVVEGSDKISIIQLAINKYTDIVLVGKGETEVSLVGAVGFESNINVRIEHGFTGEVILDRASLAGDKSVPCIDIGDNCNVVLRLIGENKLRTAGIRVPVSSSLTIVGDGDLAITVKQGRYYGIGNDWYERHGSITFDQDGCINIKANGMKGVGIGSGLGGDIYIKRGAYLLDLKGQDGVAIGAVFAESHQHIENCDMEINFGVANGTIIGSYEESADITIQNTSLRILAGSTVVTGIGTVTGEECKVEINNANVSMNILAAVECYGAGSRAGKTDISVSYARLSSSVQSKNGLALGNGEFSAKITSLNSELDITAHNTLGTDVGSNGENFRIMNGIAKFIHNGNEIIRKIEIGEL